MILTLLSVLPACPAILTYGSLADWQVQATQSGTTIDFSSFAPTPGSSIPAETSLTVGGVTFSSSYMVKVLNASASEPYYDWGTGAVLIPFSASVPVVTLATPVTAFATLVMVPKLSGPTYVSSQVTVTVARGETTLFSSTLPTSARPTPTFFGVVSSDPVQTFDRITFTPEVNYAILDDVRLGSYLAAVSAPEPGTGVLAFCGAGLLGAGVFRRKFGRRGR